MIVVELDENTKQVLLDGKIKVKETTIFENVEGHIFDTIRKNIDKINYERFEKNKREVNTIAMSPILYKYLLYLSQERMFIIERYTSPVKQIFGLNIVIRDDYEIDQIDIYRDVTKEY